MWLLDSSGFSGQDVLMWHTGPRIPTNLITGFLGAGKTTAILELLKQRPDGERWSVFVNEYGMVSIDDIALDTGSPDVQIQELAGGCFCCTTSAMMDTALIHFIRRTKPQRLLIEPSGAGHPAGVIDVLRGPRFANAIDLRATICLVDPKDFDNSRITSREVFHDQMQMADAVVINFQDKRAPDQTARCRIWIEGLDPPKLLVTQTEFGRIDPRWLDLEGTFIQRPRFPDAHSRDLHHQAASTQGTLTAPVDQAEIVSLQKPAGPGTPIRYRNAGNGQSACGWIFHPADCFDREPLIDMLSCVEPCLRIKGVFRCRDDWWIFNRKGKETSLIRTAYRRDSRLEVIVDGTELDWTGLEQALLNFCSFA
jgi:G3E family GTPase